MKIKNKYFARVLILLGMFVIAYDFPMLFVGAACFYGGILLMLD